MLQKSLSQLINSTPRILSRALTAFDLNPTIKSNRWFTSNTQNYVNEHKIIENDPILIVLNLLDQLKNVSWSPHIINKIISLCSKFQLYYTGIQLHSTVIKLGFTSNVYICSALVDFYGKCGNVEFAHKVFDEMPEINVVTWNSLVSGYLQEELPEMAIGLFLGMVRGGVTPSAFGVSAALVGCTQLGDGELGVQVHGVCFKCGVLWNVVVGTGLVDMYVKCRSLEESRRVFDWMEEKNGVTWTAMISGYAQDGLPYEAMILFREMRRLGFRASYVVCNSLLSSFSGREGRDHCRQIHCHIICEGLESNAYVQISLVTAYAECKCSLEEFDSICSCIAKWDLISWNALIAGFSHLECSEKALECFSDMRRSGIDCDFITMTSVLRAIGLVSCLEVGKQVHALAFKIGSSSNLHVQNGLVSMYGRCGLISGMKRVFSAMKEHDLISWNSLLAGLSHHGYGQEVIELFEEMRRTRIQPDQNTFISVLSACSHSGFVEKGLQFFDLLRTLYPRESLPMELYASTIDMFGRAGYVHEALALVSSMPIPPGPSIYKSLLSACKLHGNIEVGEWVSKRLLTQYPNDTAAYVLLSNSLATRCCWDEAEVAWKLMQQRGVERNPGYSWVESSK